MGLTLAGLPGARADAESKNINPAQYQTYREALIKWQAEGEIRAVLNVLVKTDRATHPEVYGNIVGPILKDASLTATLEAGARRTLFAHLIAHLVAVQPNSTDILLADTILVRLAEDVQLVEMLRAEHLLPDPTTYRNAGWDLLMRRARSLLTEGDNAVRRAAIRLVAHCNCEDAAIVLASLYDLLRASDKASAPEDAQAYLDAAERLLLHRFSDVSALLTFLNGHAEAFGTAETRASWATADKERVRANLYADVIRTLRAAGGEQASKERKAALSYGGAVIKKAKEPQELQLFFEADRPRLIELQRQALDAAVRLGPAATAPWAELLVAALDNSGDTRVLESATALLAQAFTEPGEAMQPLAAAVARRLATGVGRDRVDLRERLATVLGRIGTARDVQDALAARTRVADDPQQPVWSQLIRALGLVRNGQVLALKPYYQPPSARADWERLAVAETLGQKGFRTADGEQPNLQAPQAALFLMHILHGWAGKAIEFEVKDAEDRPVRVVRLFVGDAIESEEAVQALASGGAVRIEFAAAEPEASERVREAAVNSLVFHGRPETAEALQQAAEEANDVGAAALRILGLQLGRGSQDVAHALAALLANAPPEARLVAALDVILGAEAPGSTVARMTLGRAVTDVLTRDASDAIRRKAAAAAARLQQVEALKPIYLTWEGLAPEDEAGRAAWFALLGDLVAGVAKAGAAAPQLDADLEEGIKDLVVRGGHEENAGAFARILAGLGPDAERFALKRLRAELASQYVGVQKGRTLDERRAELDAALVLYRALVTEAPTPGQKRDMQRLLYAALHARWTKWLRTGESAESPQAFQLDALEAAVDSGDVDTAARARESEVAALKAAGDLPADVRERLDRLLPRLTTLLEAR